METGVIALEERLESMAYMSPTIVAPTMTSFIGVSSMSFDLEMIINDQLKEASVGIDMEMMIYDQPINAGAGFDVEMMIGDQSIEVSVGLDVEVRASDQLIKVDASPDMEAMADSQPIEEAPSSLQGVDEVPLSTLPYLGARGVLLERASILIDTVGQCGESTEVVEILGLVMEGSIKMAFGEAKSPMVVEVLEMLVEGPIFAERIPMAGGSISPSTLAGSTTCLHSLLDNRGG